MNEATDQFMASRSSDGQSRALRAVSPSSASVARGQSSAGEAAEPFPQGTVVIPAVSSPSAIDPTGSHPFPLGEGTGEQVGSVIAAVPARPVPDAKNGSGTGDGSENAIATGRLPFTVAHPEHTPHIPFPASQRAERAVPRTAVVPPKAGSSWSAQSIGDIVGGLRNGTLDRPRPTVGRLSDGSHWLYASAVNGLAGESGCGKSWTALTTVAAELEDSRNVIYIDLEDSAVGIVSRLLDLGVPEDLIAAPDRFAYIRPEEAFKDDVRLDLWAALEFMNPSLVVLDSTGESMALEGTDPNSDDAVAQWFKRVAAEIARRGPAVLLLDHLPKSDSAAASPIGSQRKRAAISGVQMIQTVRGGMSFAKGRSGEARLTCTKDRHGHFTTGEVAVTLSVNPAPARGESGIDAVLGRPSSDDWAPTRHMSDISQYLEQAGTAQTTSRIKSSVKGKAETLAAALRILADSGYISSRAGARNAVEYTHVKPYRIGDPYSVPDDVAAGGSSQCGHPWHDRRCNLDWCHATHRGRCNEMVELGYLLDIDGEVLEELSSIAERKSEAVQSIMDRPDDDFGGFSSGMGGRYVG